MQEKGLILLSLGTFSCSSLASHIDTYTALRTDGGGIRGLSTLYILQKILLSVKARLNLPKVPLPCEYFHLIGGTSTGG